jgi:catechol 2,3-dioxygenase-like lactoylglutathione lyase family enzyme
MKIEHVAFRVEDPVGFARWYEQHLGMRVVRSVEGPPHTRFLADAAGTTVMEVYAGEVPVPAYRAMDPFILHVAFSAEDVPAARARLISAGGSPQGDIVVTPDGDELAFVRDPWGFVIQLARRRTSLIG